MALYLPFQVALNPSAGVDLASIRVLVIIIFLLWLAEGLRNKKVFITKKFQVGLVGTFLFLNALSFLVARNQDWSIRKLAFLFSIFPLYFVATTVLNNREKVLKISKLLVAGGVVLAGMGILQFSLQFLVGTEKIYNFWAQFVILPFLGKSLSAAVIANPSWLVNIAGKTYLRATATFPDPHMLSFYLGMLIPLAIGLLLECKKKRSWLFLAVGIIIIADLLTFSRGGYLGLIAGSGFLVIVLWNNLTARNKKWIIVGVTVLLIVIFFPSPIHDRLQSIFNLQEGSNQGRIQIWKQTEQIIANNPWLGVGIGNYPLAIKASADYREPIYAHNVYLDIAAESGILSALIWIGIIVFAIKNFLERRKKELIFIGGAASLVVFAVHSLVENPLYSPTVLTLFLLIISFSNANEE